MNFWRRGRDLNPRHPMGELDFESSAFSRSATSPREKSITCGRWRVKPLLMLPRRRHESRPNLLLVHVHVPVVHL